jgi:hypothetical protein
MSAEKLEQIKAVLHHETFRDEFDKIIARAWEDEGFKKRLLSDSVATLRESGIGIPEGVKFQVMENTIELVYLILPMRPDADELKMEDLDKAAGGTSPLTAMATTLDLLNKARSTGWSPYNTGP